MNTPKSIALLGCALLTATLVYAQELSPDAKKAAEEALRQKMLELDQPSKAPAAPKVSAPKPAATTKVAPEPKSILVMPKTTSAPTPATPTLDPAVEARARELLRMKIAQPEPPVTPKVEVAAPKPAVITPKPVVVTTPAPAPKPAPKPVLIAPKPAAPVVAMPAVPATPTLAPSVEAQAREALRAKIAETTAPAPKPVVIAPKPEMATTTVTKTEAPAAKPVKAEMKKPATEAKKPVAEVKKPAAMPVVAKVPAPFAQSKMERLNELTARYLADKINPHDYHAERAKIIAEP